MKKVRLRVAIAVMIFAMAAPACGSAATPTGVPLPPATSVPASPTPAVPGGLDQEELDRLQGELSANIEKWQRTGRPDYGFEFKLDCFCPPELTAPVRIMVRDTDTIESVSYVETGEPVAENLEVYLTVGGMFDLIQEAVDMRVASLTANYDPEMGYPVNVFIDADFMIADEERGFVVRNLEFIGPPTLDEIQSRLDFSREMWESGGLSSYRMEYRRICFCAPDVTSPVVLVVEDGVRVSLAYAETGDPVAEDLADLFPWVSGMFDIIQDAIDREAAQIRVSFDSGLGYPVVISIDYNARLADEELGFSVSSLE